MTEPRARCTSTLRQAPRLRCQARARQGYETCWNHRDDEPAPQRACLQATDTGPCGQGGPRACPLHPDGSHVCGCCSAHVCLLDTFKPRHADHVSLFPGPEPAPEVDDPRINTLEIPQ